MVLISFILVLFEYLDKDDDDTNNSTKVPLVPLTLLPSFYIHTNLFIYLFIFFLIYNLI